MNNKKIFKANQKSPTSTISENICEKKQLYCLKTNGKCSLILWCVTY